MNHERTDAAFAAPAVGMAFHEMYSWWVFVLSVEPDGGPVVVAEQDASGGRGGIGRPALQFPDDARLRRFACVHEFRRAYAYESIPGYSVSYGGKTVVVDGWLAWLEQREMANT